MSQKVVQSQIEVFLKWKVKVKVSQSSPTLCDPMAYTIHRILWARILEWVAFPLLQRIFPIQGSNPGLPHCEWILYQLSHKGSPRIQEWVAYPFSRRSSQPRNQTWVSCIADGFFTNWAMMEAQDKAYILSVKMTVLVDEWTLILSVRDKYLWLEDKSHY